MSLRKKIESQMRNRPDYKISEQYYDNQALARSAAFGRDSSIQQQEANIEQSAADAIGMAGQYSNSAAGILATLASVSNNKNTALRGLAADEAAIQNQKMLNLYNANTALAEEQDKEFEYDVNMPYQQKLAYLRDRKKARTENTWKAIDTGAALSMSAGETFGQAIGGLGGMTAMSDERVKKNVTPTRYGLNEVLELNVVEFEYKHDSPAVNHIGLMAQATDKVIPEVVDKSGKYLKINYQEIVPVLIKAIQELHQIIDLQKKEIAEFKQTA